MIYVEAASGAVKRVGRCDAYATEFDLEAEEYVPLPKGDVHKRKEVVQVRVCVCVWGVWVCVEGAGRVRAAVVAHAYTRTRTHTRAHANHPPTPPTQHPHPPPTHAQKKPKDVTLHDLDAANARPGGALPAPHC